MNNNKNNNGIQLSYNGPCLVQSTSKTGYSISLNNLCIPVINNKTQYQVKEA